MTEIDIVSSLTTLKNGMLVLGDNFDLQQVTVGEIKHLVQEIMREDAKPSKIPIDKQRLWLRGYILDNDDLALSQ